MAERKRKPANKKLPTFRATGIGLPEQEDLKALKAKTLKDLQQSDEQKKEWLDKEMDKNLKKQ